MTKRKKDIKKYAIGILGGAAVIIALFFWHNKVVSDTEKEAYSKGLSECQQDTDTTYLPGATKIVYQDTTINVTANLIRTDKDTTINLSSSFDTTAVFGRDTLGIKTNVSMNSGTLKAKWDLQISHKDFAQLPDTVRVITPRYIEKVEVKNNWLYTLISYVTGLATAIIIFFFAG